MVSVDIDRTNFSVKHDRIVEITGNSSGESVVDQARTRRESKRTLIFHDGNHAETNVLKDLDAYAPLVSVGSYFIVEDGIVDLFEAGDGLGIDSDGPLAAIEKFLKTHNEFEVDSARERYVLTYNPRGFLKRVK